MVVAELERRLAQKQIAPVYLLLGDDLPGRDRALAALRAAVCPGDTLAWNLQELDGETTAGSRVVALAHTMPFLGERRLIVVHRFGRMPLEEQEQMQVLFKSPPAFCVTVLVADSLDKRTKAAQAVLAGAEVVDLTGPQADTVVSWVADLAQRMQLHMDSRTIAALVEKAGTDAGYLARELEKLAAYVGPDGVVKEEDVHAVAAAGEPELASFSGLRLAEATATGDTNKALMLLDEMLAAGESALLILGAVTYQYRLFLAAKAWEKTGPGPAASSLGVNPFPMKKAFGLARKLSYQDLVAAYEDILQADLALKRGGDTTLTLQSLIFRLTTRKAPGVTDGR